MLRHTLKTLTMLTLVVGMTIFVVSVNSQSASRRVVANIPFDFIVGDNTLPSGKYTVSAAASNSDAVRITSRDGRSSAMRLSNLVAAKIENRSAKMVFHRYGQRYFLAEVWSGGNYGHRLLQCRTERDLRRELASNPSKTDSTTGTYETVEVVALLQ